MNWEKRYREGRVRCKGSQGPHKRFKHQIIDLYAGPIAHASVIDVGCGDARFWTWKKKPKAYAGIDVSLSALTRLMRIIPGARVYNVSSAELVPGLEAEVVLCLDLIFHLMDAQTVQATITNLTKYSSKWIFIYTWVDDPSPFDDSFQAYWPMGAFDSLFERAGFELRHLARSPHDPIGGMYVYSKVGLLK
jgi:hypothetical protein